MRDRGANLLLLAVSALWLAASPAVVAGGPPVARADYREWIHGPVRYIATRSETRLFRRLQTPRERLRFIRNFWERRDPDPATAVNEARVAFWWRVSEANRRFSGTARPGWKTDRGKIFILLGPPDDIEKDPYYDTGIQDVAARGLLRWKYYGLRRAATSAVAVVPFVRTGDNDWRLVNDSRFASPTFNIYAKEGTSSFDAWRSLGNFSRLVDAVPWTGGGMLGTAMDLGRLQEAPTERELLRAVVRAQEFIGTYHGLARTTVLHGAGGRPRLALTLALDRAELVPAWDGSATSLAQRFVATATLHPTDDLPANAAPIDIPEQAFVAEPTPAEGDPYLRLQAVRPVPPGSWRLRAIVVDRRGGGVAVIESVVSVPAPVPGTPRINGPILATALNETPDRAPSGQRPFVMQNALVIPAMTDEVPPGRPFAVFVEVGPPRGRNAPVRLDWSWTRIPPGEDTARPFGPPGHLDDGRGPRAWQFGAGELPAGRYAVTFVATTAEGARSERSLEFTVPGP